MMGVFFIVILIVLFTCIFTISVITILDNETLDVMGNKFYFIPSIFMIILIVVALVGVRFTKTEKTLTMKEELYSLDSQSAVEGRFFLSFGTINTETYYYFYIKQDGYFKLEKLNSRVVRILEDDNLTPGLYLESEAGQKMYLFGKEVLPKKRKILVIPKGSITNEFNPNLR